MINHDGNGCSSSLTTGSFATQQGSNTISVPATTDVYKNAIEERINNLCKDFSEKSGELKNLSLSLQPWNPMTPGSSDVAYATSAKITTLALEMQQIIEKVSMIRDGFLENSSNSPSNNPIFFESSLCSSSSSTSSSFIEMHNNFSAGLQDVSSSSTTLHSSGAQANNVLKEELQDLLIDQAIDYNSFFTINNSFDELNKDAVLKKILDLFTTQRHQQTSEVFFGGEKVNGLGLSVDDIKQIFTYKNNGKCCISLKHIESILNNKKNYEILQCMLGNKHTYYSIDGKKGLGWQLDPKPLGIFAGKSNIVLFINNHEKICRELNNLYALCSISNTSISNMLSSIPDDSGFSLAHTCLKDMSYFWDKNVEVMNSRISCGGTVFKAFKKECLNFPIESIASLMSKSNSKFLTSGFKFLCDDENYLFFKLLTSSTKQTVYELIDENNPISTPIKGLGFEPSRVSSFFNNFNKPSLEYLIKSLRSHGEDIRKNIIGESKVFNPLHDNIKADIKKIKINAMQNDFQKQFDDLINKNFKIELNSKKRKSRS